MEGLQELKFKIDAMMNALDRDYYDPENPYSSSDVESNARQNLDNSVGTHQNGPSRLLDASHGYGSDCKASMIYAFPDDSSDSEPSVNDSSFDSDQKSSLTKKRRQLKMRRKRKQKLAKTQELARAGDRKLLLGDPQSNQVLNFNANVMALIGEIKDSERQLFRVNPRMTQPMLTNIHTHESDLHLGQQNSHQEVQIIKNDAENFVETNCLDELVSLKYIYSKEMFWERVNVFLDNSISKKVLQSLNNLYDHSSAEVAFGLAQRELHQFIKEGNLRDQFQDTKLSLVLADLLNHQDPQLKELPEIKPDLEYIDRIRTEIGTENNYPYFKNKRYRSPSN